MADRDPKHGHRSSFDLLASAQAGDDRALEAIYSKYTPRFRRWAHGRLPGWARDLVDTDAIVHETLARTIGHIDGILYEREGAFQAYIRQALRNRVYNEMDRAQRRPDIQSMGERPATALSPLDQIIGRETQDKYEKSLRRLSVKQREAVIARLELGCSYAEVASSVGFPSSDAARMAVGRALARLAREMSS